MKIQGHIIIYTFLVFVYLSVTVTYAVDCSKYTVVGECVSKRNCEFYTANSCSGSAVSICANTKQCDISNTCAQDPHSKMYYSFPTNCLPVGFISALSKKCTCSTKPPPGPPAQTCSDQFTEADCKLYKDLCDSITGKACGDQTISICRSKNICPVKQRCVRDPISQLFYLFQRTCVPDGWTLQPIENCTNVSKDCPT